MRESERLYIERENPMKETIIHRKEKVNIHVNKKSESFEDQLI